MRIFVMGASFLPDLDLLQERLPSLEGVGQRRTVPYLPTATRLVNRHLEASFLVREPDSLPAPR